MAMCHDLFAQFHDKIALTKAKVDDLDSARDGIRTRIVRHFEHVRKDVPPHFRTQGSFPMCTAVNPLGGEYDIDDGVYLRNLSPENAGWPTPETVHAWIVEATKGHTGEKPTDKRTCVRVQYAGNYHVDLPIYGTHLAESYLAEKGDMGWHVSEPVKYVDWFVAEVKRKGEQLRRVVRFLKAWADYRARKGNMPSSIVLTTLATSRFFAVADSDDASFGRTAMDIQSNLGTFVVANPVDTSEDLAVRMDAAAKNRFRERLNDLVCAARRALQGVSKKESCELWREQLGDRFPNCDNVEEKSTVLKTAAPALLHDDARSA